MADYKSIKGTKIQNYTTDPDNPLTGQVWYNETDQVLKTFYVNPGSWSTGGDLNIGRRNFTGAGTQTAGLTFGGGPTNDPTISPSANVALTESYNGSTWTELNDMNTARRYLGGAGTQTAALGVGGFVAGSVANVESWDGTSWTETTDLTNAKRGMAMSGTNTAALSFGCSDPSPRNAETESWNGSSWTEVNDLNTGRGYLEGCGTQTAALAFAGNNPPPVTGATESWNGTSWTEVGDLNNARKTCAGFGTQTAALIAGGPGSSALTESWNGTNWTELGNLNVGRSYVAGCGTNTSGLAFGGFPPDPPVGVSTEEWNAGPATKTITSS